MPGSKYRNNEVFVEEENKQKNSMNTPERSRQRTAEADIKEVY